MKQIYIAFYDTEVLYKVLQAHQGHHAVFGVRFAVLRGIVQLIIYQLFPGHGLVLAACVVGMQVALQIGQGHIGVLLLLHYLLHGLIERDHIPQVGRQVGAGACFIQFILCILADHGTQCAELCRHAVPVVSVCLVHRLVRRGHRVSDLDILPLGGIADRRCIGGDGAHAQILGGDKGAVLILCIGVIGVQLGNTPVPTVGRAPQGAVQQVGGVQLGRAQRQIINAVAGVRQVHQVAPLQVGTHHIRLGGCALVNIKVIRLRAVRLAQGDLQSAVSGQGGGDAGHLRSPGQGDPRKGSRYRHNGRHQQAQAGGAELLPHMRNSPRI